VRIVYLNPCGRLGGAETSLRGLLASLRAAEPGCDLCLVLGEDGPLAALAQEIGVSVMVRPFPPALARIGDARNGLAATILGLTKALWGTAAYAWRLAQTLKSMQPDIVHTNGFKMHLLGALARPKGTPLVWHIHDYAGSRRLMGRLLRVFGRACTVVVANSKSVAADLKTILPKARVVPIYNAVDLDRFAPQGSKLNLDELAQLPEAPPGTVRVGLLATFARWKGHKVFLQAMSKLSAESHIRGYIVGGPIYQTSGSQWSVSELQKEVNRLRLAGRVGFTGFLENTAAAMRSLDIIVHASTEPEPFGMVIIEGMACGKPVIASRAGGACELFVDGEDALGHCPGDVEGLARQIHRLACDEQLRHSVGKAGRATSERVFDGARLAEEMLTVYREICNYAPGAHRERLAQSSVSTVNK
jgi:glycosyltransferase involved in cell wall biosynthesis